VSPATSIGFVLTLHSHLPYVLHHGRWPHGSDWLCEAALDSYLPLLEVLHRLADDGIPAPATVGLTPVLANQLASPAFGTEMEAFFAQRLAACDEAPASLSITGEGFLLPLVSFWRTRLLRLRRLFEEIGGDIPGAFRALETAGRIELIGSAATHGFLPLLARDESIRLQLAVGVREHRRLFGRAPTGCWLPECAYRPRGPWQPAPGGPRAALRRGIDEHLADAGFRYFFTDAHLAAAGRPLGVYGDPTGEPARHAAEDPAAAAVEGRSPYLSYRLPQPRGGDLAVLVRDPRSSMQVWSRHHGYPGDEWYLEFHKIRWPGGLKLWRVSAPGSDLGAKAPYDPAAALGRAAAHAAHFAGLLEELGAGEAGARDAVLVAPFDSELFGHWWFEGPEFLVGVYRELARRRGRVRPATAGRHLEGHPPRAALRLAAGSWGANGDFGMWLGPATRWTWERLWPLEERFWDAAPAALGQAGSRPVLAQAARELLLAQSSDWQFIISTGAAADYAERRFREHCEVAEELVGGLERGDPELEGARHRAEELRGRDDLFPEILPAVAAALGGSRSLLRD
jgi:1,4-alpha-glucan branching enzyme